MSPVKRASADPSAIELKPLDIKSIELRIVGDTELILHAWSKKAREQMLAKQMGTATPKKERKDPDRDYEESFYRLPDGTPGFPAPGFKAACVGGCRFFDGLAMTVAKISLRVRGVPDASGVEMIAIEGTPRKREDMVRLETGVADIRFRPGFPHWRAVLPITFVGNVLSTEQVVNLVNAAGQLGVGEWRPSAPKVHSGTFGCFHVATDEEWQAYEVLL